MFIRVIFQMRTNILQRLSKIINCNVLDNETLLVRDLLSGYLRGETLPISGQLTNKLFILALKGAPDCSSNILIYTALHPLNMTIHLLADLVILMLL